MGKFKQHVFYNNTYRTSSLPEEINKFIETSKEKFSEMYKVNIEDIHIDSIDTCVLNLDRGYLCTLVLGSSVE